MARESWQARALAAEALLDGEERRWATLTRKYTASVALDRENLRTRLLRVLPAERAAITAVWREYEAEYPATLTGEGPAVSPPAAPDDGGRER